MSKERPSWRDFIGNYAAVIREAREAAGMNQSELSRASGIDTGSISQVGEGTKQITVYLYNSFVRALPNIDRIRLLNAMGYRVEVPSLKDLSLTAVTQLAELRPPYREIAERAIASALEAQRQSMNQDG